MNGYNSGMISKRITANDHCRRLESLLRNLLPKAPLSYLKKLVRSGHVTVNGEMGSPDTMLLLDDSVEIKESARTRELITETRPDLDILYEDQWIIAFNKDAGLPVHRAAEVDDRNLVEMGRKLLADRGIEGKLRPVNRLDRGTSGTIITAKSPTAAGMFGRMVKEEGLSKLYLAITAGRLPDEGSITAPLEGKVSETRFRLISHGDGCSLAAVYPITGRMHQIRRHLSLYGHPILGDRRYGSPPLPSFTGIPLHSFRTAFTHPATGERTEIFAPLPEQFLSLLVQLTVDDFPSLLRSLPGLP
jgi:23S rRNA pseudouridine955/2504/2580 synthase